MLIPAMKTIRTNKGLSFAVILGNTVAWADFALYAYFSPVLSKVFFPFTTKANAYILYFIVFALAFLFRPIGSTIAGIYADRHGRKNTLLATVAISSVVIGAIALLPSYRTIGFFSPLLLTVFRILQTMSVSAEPTNSGSLLIESAPQERKGLATSIVMIGIFTGFLLGIFSFYIFSEYLTMDQMVHWGWRLSYGLFAVLGIVPVLVLMRAKESKLYLEKKSSGKINPHPFRDSLRHHKKVIFISFGYSIMMAAANYFLLGFIPKFLSDNIGISLKAASASISLCLIITVLLIPLMGYLSDIFGRRLIMGAGALGFVIFAYPMELLFTSGHLWHAFIALAIYSIFLAPVAAVLPAAIAEMFPFSVRCTAGAIGYNAGLVLVGGTTPIIVESLLSVTKTASAPFLFLSTVAFVHLVFVIFSKETRNNDISK